MFIFMALLLLYSFLQSFNDCKDLFEDFFFGSMVSYDGVGGVPVEGDSFLIEVVDFWGPSLRSGRFSTSTSLAISLAFAVKEEDVAIFLEVFYAGTSFDDAAPVAMTRFSFSERSRMVLSSASRKASSEMAKREAMVLPSFSSR